MLYNFNFYSSILLVFFSQGIVFAFLLFRKAAKENRFADRVLGIFTCLCCLYILPWMLGFAGWYFVQPYRDFMFYLPMQQVLLVGPLLYFYTKSLLDISFRIRRKDYFHFIPAALYFSYSLVIWITDKIILKDYFFYADGHDKDLDSWYQVAGLISMTVYLFISIKHYSNYKKNIYQTVSFAETILFRWIQKYLVAFFLMQLLRLAFLFLYPDWGNFNAKGWYYLAFSILFYYIAISALLSNESAIVPLKLDENNENKSFENQKNTIFEESELDSWKQRISLFIAQHKSYQNPELTLAGLAADLKTNPTKLSKVINNAYKMNFNDFINSLRIAAIKTRLDNLEHERHTLLSIALDCGFNSKTTFNRAFKKNTAVTPKDYIAKHAQKIQLS